MKKLFFFSNCIRSEIGAIKLFKFVQTEKVPVLLHVLTVFCRDCCPPLASVVRIVLF